MSFRAVSLALFAIASAPVLAQDDGLFARKTVTIYVGNTAGGTYDLYARLVSRHLSRFLPGKPSIVVENKPGAGTMLAANFIYGVAPKDGTALGIVAENLAIEQSLSNPAVQFDASKFTWIARVGPTNAIHMMWHTSKVQSIEDAKKYEAALAGAGAGNLSEVIPTLLNAIIGTKFKIIHGYPAATESMLAMERGEVEGASANWATLKYQRKDWLAEKKVKVILQDLQTRGPDLPDVPALAELGDTPEDRQLTGLYGSVGAIGRSFFAPPGVPAPATAALRDGMAAMMRDGEFLADAERSTMELAPASGGSLQETVVKTLAMPESVRAKGRAIFAK